MTAPSPAGLSPLLDQLDEARAAATPGPWEVWTKGQRHIDSEQWDGIVQVLFPADAALIVAAVNALPQLTAALRAVIKLTDEWDAHADRFLNSDLRRGAYIAAASGVRSTLTAALTPGADTAGATA